VSKVNILDASAILAYLQQEDGQDKVEAAFDLAPSWVSAVNYCEVVSKLCEKGMPSAEAHDVMDDLAMTVVDFDISSARLTADLRVRTKAIGASLGDRACLALAEHAMKSASSPIVYTAEIAWTKLKWPFQMVLIRNAKSST
jgi:PIN domain nuclease of toxin-antitoxin system